MADVWLPETLRVLLMAALLGGLVAASEGLRRWGRWPVAMTRRFVHVGVGLSVSVAPWFFSGPEPLFVLGVAFVLINALARWRRAWPAVHSARPASIGTVVFPLALLPALVVGWWADPSRVFAVQVSFLILALADPAASYVGRRTKRPGRFRIGTQTKSVVGTFAFFVTALVVSGAALGAFVAAGTLDWNGGEVLVAAFVVASVTAAVEVLGTRGWDNFFIVQAALLVLIVFDESVRLRLILVSAVVVGVAFAVLAYRVRALDRSGAIAGGLLAASLIAVGTWAWAVPALAFFILSSLLSKAGRRHKTSAERLAEKGAVRDAGQVYANGGLAWALLLVHAVFPSPVLYAGFLGAFAAAAADTWATELGTWFGGAPRMVTTGRRVPPGTSGAVSGAGLLAALAGAGVVAVSAWPFGLAGGVVLVVLAAGFLGALADSVAGATVQAVYSDPESGGVTERRGTAGRPHRLVRGRRWVTNDRVNELCTAVGALLAMLGAAWVGML